MKILKEQFVEVPAEKCCLQFFYWFDDNNRSTFLPAVKFSHHCFECNGKGTCEGMFGECNGKQTENISIKEFCQHISKESRIELKQSLHKLIEDLFEFEKKEDK